MNFFKLFTSAKTDEAKEMLPSVSEQNPVIDTERETASEDEAKERSSEKYITITWGTGEPIDVLFNFIHRNMEEEGYSDALVNSDPSYKDAKENIIRNDLKMLFKRVSLRYNDCVRQVEVQIDRAEAAFISSAVTSLKAKKETYLEHILEIQKMEQMLEDNDPKMTTMIETYKRGFYKGIATQTQMFLTNNQ